MKKYTVTPAQLLASGFTKVTDTVYRAHGVITVVLGRVNATCATPAKCKKVTDITSVIAAARAITSHIPNFTLKLHAA